MSKGFYIFCDESLKKGPFYSNFYGGVMIDKGDFEGVNNALRSKAQDLGMEDSELKWSNMNSFRLEAYMAMMDVFFGFVNANMLKVRIMFTDNRYKPTGLSSEQRQNQYHILYYHFLKHAFGLRYLHSDVPVDLEFFIDYMPHDHDQKKKFKKFVYGLQFLPEFADSQIVIKEWSIYEVDSKSHVLVQCLDVVLGAMAFRLNDMHTKKADGSNRRGKRTVAKEKLYKHINKHLRLIRPHFNIGISTGLDEEPHNLLLHPYRHWLFIPTNSEYDMEE